jgi:uncharacterized C2H2 Zn-finger protein
MVPRPGEPPRAMSLFPDASPHRAASVIVSERDGDTYQPCERCGTPLVRKRTGEPGRLVPFDDGEQVGSGCPGNKTRRREGGEP